MTKIEVRKNEDIDKVLRKFKTKVRRDGVIDEIKKREYYEKPSQKKRKQEERARMKENRRRTQNEW